MTEYIVTDEAVCPEGGEYRIIGNAEDGFFVSCKTHDGWAGTIFNEVTRKKLFDALKDIKINGQNFKTYFGDQNQQKYVDSGAKSVRTDDLNPIFKQILNNDLSDVKTWALGTNGTKNGNDNDLKLYWTTKDISSMNKNETVTTICYNIDNPGYSLATMKVGDSDKNYGYGDYKTMRYESSDGQTYSTYEEAYAAYKATS